MRVVVLLCAFTALFPVVASGEEKQAGTGFADYLFKKGEFDRAITEYERVLYAEHGTQPISDEVQYKLILCYKQLGQSEKTNILLEQAIDHGGANLRKISLFEGGLLHYEEGHYAVAAEDFKAFQDSFPGDTLVDDARYMRGVSAAMLGEADVTHNSFQSLRDQGIYSSSSIDIEKELVELEALPSKSRAVAGILSAVVPGAGQCYAGRCLDGASALLVNGALGGLTAAAFINKEPVLGGILGFVESWFYLGNIYGARSAAYKHNQQSKTSIMEGIARHVRFDIVNDRFSSQVGAFVTIDLGGS